MSPYRIAIASLSLLAALLAAPRALAAPSPFVPGEVLVKFRPDATPRHQAAAVAAQGHATVADLPVGWKHVRVAPGQSVEQAIAAYAADPTVEDAQPNFIYRIASVPNDPGYPQQWGLRNTGQTSTSVLQPTAERYATANPGTPGADIHVEPAWSVITDCRPAIVAVLDSGVNYVQEDLAANMWDGGLSYPNHGYNFVDGDDDPMDLNGHGTHVAGIIAAVGNNGVGVSGVCWQARIMAIRSMDALGGGTSANIVQGLNFAVTHGAKVVNMSIGGGGTPDPAYSAAVTAAQNAGVLLVVAAGNEGSNNDASPSYPCSFTQPNVLCVAALDQSYGLAYFSNWGATSVDVGAPGTNILSTWTGLHTLTQEAIVSGWTSATTTSGGWWIGSSGGANFLIDPVDYGTYSYNANTDDRVWKSFNFSGASVVTVDFQAAIDLAAGDSVRIGCKSTAGDPFSGGTNLGTATGVRTSGQPMSISVELMSCASAATTLGFQLQSQPATTGNYGVVISPMTFKRLDLTTNSYNTIAGTSMATPVVAGLATLLRAYHPSYTHADTKSAIVDAGRAVPALIGKTTSGKAIDAMASLAYIHPPTGLTYAVH